MREEDRCTDTNTAKEKEVCEEGREKWSRGEVLGGGGRGVGGARGRDRRTNKNRSRETA